MANVIKRDGRIVQFDKEKIINAVTNAFMAVDNELNEQAIIKAKDIAVSIESQIVDEISVEEIQNIVEEKLMSSKRKDVAKSYIIYRNERDKERDKRSVLTKKVKEKIEASAVENQNANMDERSFGGRMGSVNSEVLKKYALDYCMSEMSKNNHLNNEIYIHDLDHYALGDHNCLSIPFDKLLANGFNTRQTDVRPAKSVNTAFQLIAVLMQLQSLQQFGGVSATHVDWTMVPYVRMSFAKHFVDGMRYIEECEFEIPNNIQSISISDDSIYMPDSYPDAYNYALDKTEQEIHQAVEGMYHNLNTLQSRSGNQLPFSSINYGTCTLIEGRMITKALLEVSIEGIGKLHRTSIFPCGIFQMMKGINRKKGDPNYDLFQLALKSTAKRLYPNYANVDWSVNKGYDKNDPRTYVSTINNLVA